MVEGGGGGEGQTPKKLQLKTANSNGCNGEKDGDGDNVDGFGRLGICTRCRASTALSIMHEKETAITNPTIIHLSQKEPMLMPPSISTLTFYSTSHQSHLPFYTQITQ